MTTSFQQDTLTFRLDSTLDASNARSANEEILAACSAHPDATVVLDAEDMIYISSAGLRIVLALLNDRETPVRMENVSPAVWGILEDTGFTELMPVRKKLRSIELKQLEGMGTGAYGSVLRYTEDEIVKVYRQDITLEEIDRERDVTRRAFLLGVPCEMAFDTVRIGPYYGTVYEALNALTVSERIQREPDRLPELAEKMAALLRRLHAIHVPENAMPSVSRDYQQLIERIEPFFTPEEMGFIRGMYSLIPEEDRFVHADFHPRNAMEADGKLTLIDMGLSGAGHPMYDWIHCVMIFRVIDVPAREKSSEGIGFAGITFDQMDQFWSIFWPGYFGKGADRMESLLKPMAWIMAGMFMLPGAEPGLRANLTDRIRRNALQHPEETVAGLEKYFAEERLS